MGMSLNPVEYRVGYTRSWEDAWFLQDVFYPVFLHKILLLKSLINYLMYYGVFPNRELSWVFSHSEFMLVNNQLVVNIYIYDTVLSGFFFGQTHKLRSFLFKNLRLPSFWMKKKLLDQKFRAQHLMKVMNLMNVYVSNQLIDHLKFRFYNKGIKRLTDKLNGLRKRYGKNWLGEEEIFFWQTLFFLFENDRLRGFFYLKWLTRFFRFYYSKYRLRSKIRKKKILERDLHHVRTIRKNIYKIYFFLLFFTRMLSLFTMYPIKQFDQKFVIFLLRLYYAWFFQKPVFFQFKNYIEWILMYFKFEAKVVMYAVVNPNLSASFVARFIAEAIDLQFNLRDLIGLLHVYLLRSMKKQRVVFYDKYMPSEKNKYFFKKRKRFYNKVNYIRNYKFFLKTSFSKLFFFVKLKHVKYCAIYEITFFLKKKISNILNLLWLKNSGNAIYSYKFYKYIWLRNIFLLLFQIKGFFNSVYNVSMLKNLLFVFFNNKRCKVYNFFNFVNVSKSVSLLEYVNYNIFFCFYSSFVVSHNFFKVLINYARNLDINLKNKERIENYLAANDLFGDTFISDRGRFKWEQFESTKKNKFFFKTQKSRLKVLNNLESFFFGYKLNFVGRFSRKQRSSNFWFSEGGVPSSSISLNVDYGSFSINLENSRCTVKVWLYRNRITPYFKTRF